MGARENGGREGGGGARPRGPWKLFPAPYTITWQPLRDLSKIFTANDWPRTNKACQDVVIVHLLPTYICYKDQLGYLIIERWSNKPMINTQY